MNIGDVVVSRVDATTDRSCGAVVLPCIDADDGTRYFFGPLLVHATGVKRSHSLYRKIRHMAARRIATDAEMAFVRRRRPDVWETVMRERHAQVEQEANKNTRERMRRRRRAAERAASQAKPSSAFVTPPRSPALPRRAHAAPREIVFQCPTDRADNGNNNNNNDDDDNDDFALVIDDEDEDETKDMQAAGARNPNRDAAESVNGKEDDGDAGDDDGDGDYDADGAGDLVPMTPLPRRPRSAHLAGVTATVTADTIYLVEATSRLIEFLGNNVVVAVALDTVDNNDAKRDGRNGPAPVSGRRGVKRPWEDVLADVSAWAAARDAVLVDWARCGVEDTGLGTLPHMRRRHRRKQARPIRALKPFAS
ncbi:hypothetical protein psal_cds_1189 [Pandoravirus salinus]|uniref:Uncharacterized protein n=1 Tax=Pandoravirus salinus TaxID=1349410 RepID=S4W579_9VIRU|nr:hypothetical protein psal_cds_1189 [Pandoravirus salinus]AGO85475.1 hypothetical protein psal_cds_1189 [Pandoravirus salinus]